jgi:retinol dehydrogenase 12
MSKPDKTSLSGKVALITGANTGIGLVTARELAARGAHLFIACRSAQAGQQAIDAIRSATGNQQVELMSLDLGDFDSVRRCAQTFLARSVPLHLLINNAGLAGVRGLSKSGFEVAFGVNHVGHFLLTQLLIDHIKRSAPARIVTVASKAHYRARGIDWNRVRKPATRVAALPEYAVSKLANVLFSAELARRLEGSGVSTYSLHPGVVASDIWRAAPWPIRSLLKLTMISTEEGALTSIYCATSPEAGAQTGLYYDRCRPKAPSTVAQGRALAAELWARSEDWVR